MNARTQLAIVILLFLALVVLLKIDRELSRERELSRIILAEAVKKINQLAFLVNEREMLDGETTTDDCIVEQEEGQLQILDALDCLIEKMNRQNIRIMKQRKESE